MANIKERETDIEPERFLFAPDPIKKRVSYLVRKFGSAGLTTERIFEGRRYQCAGTRTAVNGYVLAERYNFEGDHPEGVSSEFSLETVKQAIRPSAIYVLYGLTDMGTVSIELTSYVGNDGKLGYIYRFNLPRPDLSYNATQIVVVRDTEESPFSEIQQRDIAAALGINL